MREERQGDGTPRKDARGESNVAGTRWGGRRWSRRWRGQSLMGAAGSGMVAFLALSGAATVPMAYRDGPPPGFSGGFGEPACDACHFSGPLNDGVGTLSIEGLEEDFVPGKEYLLTIVLTRPEMRAAGFQLTSRFAESGEQAGELAPPPGEDERVGVTTDREIQYAFQRLPGSSVEGADTARWTVRWTAPAERAAIRFDVAANAADGDESSSGDFVYTTGAEVTPHSP